MPKQLTDEEFARLSSRAQVADFVEGIYNDPQLNREAKALIKKKYPQITIPDYDLMTQVSSGSRRTSRSGKRRSAPSVSKRSSANSKRPAPPRRGFTASPTRR